MKIYEEGLEKYPVSRVIIGNILMLLWIGLGAYACHFIHPLLTWIYLVLAIVIIYVVLRRIVCVNCYYYGKRCALGWGKLSALMVKKGEIEQFPKSTGIRIAPFVYGSLTVIPVVLVVISMLKTFTVTNLIVLLLILLIGFISGTVTRKNTCSRCKMRFICPGSAAK